MGANKVAPFNANNQSAAPGFGYDRMGNPTQYRGQAFRFDPESRLTHLPVPATSSALATTVDASYDGDGLRATKTAGGVTTYFLYDGGTPVCEETWNGTWRPSPR